MIKTLVSQINRQWLKVEDDILLKPVISMYIMRVNIIIDF